MRLATDREAQPDEREFSPGAHRKDVNSTDVVLRGDNESLFLFPLHLINPPLTAHCCLRFRPMGFTKDKYDIGKMRGATSVTFSPKRTYRSHKAQYPLRKEEGIGKILTSLLSKGAVVTCTSSPCNTPICTG